MKWNVDEMDEEWAIYRKKNRHKIAIGMLF